MTSARQGGLGAMKVAVITISDRSTSGERPDETGPILAQGLRDMGAQVTQHLASDDIQQIRSVLTSALSAGADAVVTSGGTGVGPRDNTPEATAPLLTTLMPGIPELLRQRDASASPLVSIGRGLAGLTSGRSLVVNLPGSPRAVRSALEVLPAIMLHVYDQTRGGDH